MPIVFSKDKKLKKSYNKTFGLFIGVENFLNSNNKIPSLLHSNEDAEELCTLFWEKSILEKQQYELCLLTDKPFLKKIKLKHEVKTKEATRANILGEITKFLKVARPDDLIIVYFSSHGEIDYDDYFFVPSDGDIENLLGTGISSSTIIKALGKGANGGVKVLLLVDTCYAGAIGFEISKYKGEFSCILSSSPVEFSYEFFHVEHGIFTNYLIKGLKGKAQKDGLITIVSLYDYIYRNVQRETSKKQNPLMIGTMKYDFILFVNDENDDVKKESSY